MLISFAQTVSDSRRSLGWTQSELAARCGMSPSMVSLIERALVPDVSLGTIASICDAMGVQVSLAMKVPFLVDRQRQREPAHTRCVAHVQRRLERAGWLVEREAEIAQGSSHGWIDVLAFHPERQVLLVVEVKTELHDLGELDRTVGWYGRAAWGVARGFGWRPSRALAVVLVLATDLNDDRIRENREPLALAYPARAAELMPWVGDPVGDPAGGRRGLAMIDPLSRRAVWLRAMRVDGRRSPAPYPDYAGFMSRLGRGAGPVGRGAGPVGTGSSRPRATHDPPLHRLP
jgi:transcriptional regulator with XRE-family HTH domain